MVRKKKLGRQIFKNATSSLLLRPLAVPEEEEVKEEKKKSKALKTTNATLRRQVEAGIQANVEQYQSLQVVYRDANGRNSLFSFLQFHLLSSIALYRTDYHWHRWR